MHPFCRHRHPACNPFRLTGFNAPLPGSHTPLRLFMLHSADLGRCQEESVRPVEGWQRGCAAGEATALLPPAYARCWPLHAQHQVLLAARCCWYKNSSTFSPAVWLPTLPAPAGDAGCELCGTSKAPLLSPFLCTLTTACAGCRHRGRRLGELDASRLAPLEPHQGRR